MTADDRLLNGDLYDEFGNFIGPEETSASSDECASSGASEDAQSDQETSDEQPPPLQIVAPKTTLHEDKVYYASASETFGRNVEVLVHDEDTQPLDRPIIQPVSVATFRVSQRHAPPTVYAKEYVADLMNFPERIRNVVLLGALHAGKTTCIDVVVAASHIAQTAADRAKFSSRYADCSVLEKKRGVSLAAHPMTFVLPTARGKSHLVHFVDTPGHADFADAVAAGVRLADGALLVVDAVEGVTAAVERALRRALAGGLSVVLLINKIDRLVLELRLPPVDAFFKLRSVVDSLNTLASAHGCRGPLFAPERGNVLFASLQDGWLFSLRSIAQIYAARHSGVDSRELAKRLWGDVFWDESRKRFVRNGATARSFVHFVLDPIYKLYSSVLGFEGAALVERLAAVGVVLRKSEHRLDLRPLLLLVLKRFFGGTPCEALVDALADHVPDPQTAAASTKLALCYGGPLNSRLSACMQSCDASGPLVMHVTLLIPEPAEGACVSTFLAYGRIMSGTLRKGTRVRVLGESFIAGIAEEDAGFGVVDEILIYECQYSLVTDSALAGSLVTVRGSGAWQSHIVRSATIVDAHSDVDAEASSLAIFKPLSYDTIATFKVAVEPVIPADLPKMVAGLRNVCKAYPLCYSRVEESGEHVIIGPGELYVDCVLHDLRRVYADVEIRVSDPACTFRETVVETSLLRCVAETPNHRNQLSMIAEPLDRGLAEDLESGYVHSFALSSGADASAASNLFEPLNNRAMAGMLQSKYAWDVLAARSVWAFGPHHTHGSNVLIDDCLPTETNKERLYAVKDHIVHGFRWTCREGPLCEEPIRGVKFRLLDAAISQDAIYRGSGQIIPTARKVCYSALLTASPRLVEPIYAVEVSTPADCIDAIYTLLARRRGHIVQEAAVGASPFCTLQAFVPVIDAVGFESDLRIVTQGQAFSQATFDHWEVVPGDPLDASLVVRPLEAADAVTLARDFMLKTRHRKGLSPDVAVAKFFDDATLAEITAKQLSLASGV